MLDRKPTTNPRRIRAVLHRLKVLPTGAKVGLWALCFVGLASRVAAETVLVGVGVDQTRVVSSQYKTQSVSGAMLAATYSRPLMGVWSLLAQYRMNFSNTLTAGLLGIAYDSDEMQTKGGALAPDGRAEITRNPIWLFRSSLSFGAFRYVDTLESNNANLGTKNQVPVQADLYGLTFGVDVLRLVSESWGVNVSGSYSVASAQNFGISSTSVLLGSTYRY